MTLTLTDEEVVVYMTMKQTIEDLQSKLRSAANEYTTKPEIITEYDWKESTSTLSEPVEFADAHTTWTEEEKRILSSRIFKTGLYAGYQREFSVIRALFPTRTEAGVKSMIYTLGGTCKKGIVQPKLKGVK